MIGCDRAKIKRRARIFHFLCQKKYCFSTPGLTLSVVQMRNWWKSRLQCGGLSAAQMRWLRLPSWRMLSYVSTRYRVHWAIQVACVFVAGFYAYVPHSLIENSFFEKASDTLWKNDLNPKKQQLRNENRSGTFLSYFGQIWTWCRSKEQVLYSHFI